MIDFINYTVNGVFATCKMELPETMYFDHPLGSVIGRAKIGRGFVAMQNCTIGSKNSGNKVAFPSLGENVIMCSNSSIIGTCRLGDNVIVAANCHINDVDIPSNSIVFPHGDSIKVVTKTRDEIKKYIKDYWRL